MPALSGMLARPRLFDELERTPPGGLTWLHAPAGAGKTSLVASYLEQREVLWYEVDAGDRDVSAVLYHLGVAAGAFMSSAVELPVYQPAASVDLTVFAKRFFSSLFARLDRPFWLVLDNEQEASADPAWDTMLRELIGSLPAQGRLLVASRRAPPLGLARYRAVERLRVLDFDALRFEPDEVAQLLGPRGPEAGELTRITRGWAMAVSMLARIERAGEPIGIDDESPWEALERGDHDACDDWLLRCERETDALGFAYARHTARCGRLVACALRGDSQLASLLESEAVAIEAAPSHRQRAVAALVLAFARIRLGTCADAELANAMSRARCVAFTGDYFIGPRVIRALCTEALTRSIEADYAAKLVRSYELAADEQALLLPSWPWPIRVKLLGTVELVVEGKPVEFGRKLPRVPLALLKLLAVTPGTLPLDKVGSGLWPELGRSARRAALDSAVYRLRKLLDAEALVLDRGELGLNHARCWTDVRAAQRICALPLDERLRQTLAGLAHGPLASDSDPKPILQASEQLRTRIERALA